MNATSRLTALLDVLRIAGWTTDKRNSLVTGLPVDAAIERVQRAIDTPPMSKEPRPRRPPAGITTTPTNSP